MNEQAILDSYNLFVQNGYKKSLDEFKKLIASNPEALNDSYNLFVGQGYKKSLDDYKALIGVGAQPVSQTEPAKKKVDTALPSADGSLVSAPKVIDETPKEKDFFTGIFGSVLKGMDAPGSPVAALGLGDLIDDFGRSVYSGIKQGSIVSPANELMFKGKGADKETIKKYMQAAKAMEGVGPSDEMIAFTKDYEQGGKGIVGFLKGLANNPGVLPEIVVSSMTALANPSSLAAGGAIVGGSTAVGAGVGAAGAGVGAVPGAVTGFLRSIPYAMGAANTVLETGLTFSELLNDELKTRGLEFNEENIKKVLEDEKVLSKLRVKSAARGATIGAIDAITGRVAGKVGAKLASNTAAGKIKAGLAATGIEAAGGSAGEAAGRLVAGQEMDIAEIGLEGIAEAPMSAVSLTAEVLKKPVFKVNGEYRTEADINEILNTADDEDLAKMDIRISNDNKGYANIIQQRVVKSQVRKEVKESNPDADENTVEQLVDLEVELKKFEGKTTQSAKDKAAAIRSRIKEIQSAADNEKAFLSQLKDDEVVPIYVNSIEEIPEQFRDRAVERQPMEIKTREKILGLPIGKEKTERFGGGYMYTLTGKEAKEYAIQKQSTDESVLRSQESQVGLQEVGEGNQEPQVATEGAKAGEVTTEGAKPVEAAKVEVKGFGETPEQTYEILSAIDISGGGGSLSALIPAEQLTRVLGKLRSEGKPERYAVAEAYHEDKAAGKETDLVGAVEYKISNYQQSAPTLVPAPMSETPAPGAETPAAPTNIPEVEAVETVDTSIGFEDYTPQELQIGEEVYYSFDGNSYSKGKVVSQPSPSKPNVYTIQNENGVPTVVVYGGDRTNVKLKRPTTEVSSKTQPEKTTLERALDFLDNMEADLDAFGNETMGINIAIPVLKAIIKTVKALVKGGMALQDAIRAAAQQNNVSEDDVRDALNFVAEQRVAQGVPDSINEIELPGYNRMMDELQGVIDKTIERGGDSAQALDNALAYLQGSRVYESASDTQREAMVRDVRKRMGKREKPAPKPGKLFGTLKDAKTFTMTEYDLLKKQLADKAKGAKNAIAVWRKTGVELAAFMKDMVGKGYLTTKQAAVVIKKFAGTNLLDEQSIERFVDYMAKVFKNADYAEQIAQVRAALPAAKKAVNTKIGIAKALTPLMQRLFAINPMLIPDAVFADYVNLVKTMGENKAVLALDEYGQMTDRVQAILDAVDEEASRAEELGEVFMDYSEKVTDEEGKIDFSATVKKMVEDGSITEEDAEILRKYKRKIMPPTPAQTKTKEELEQEKDELVDMLKQAEVDSDGLPTKDERNLARKLQKLIRTDAVRGLDNAQLKNLLRLVDNINNGFLPHLTQLMVERLEAVKNSRTLLGAIGKANPLKLSLLYSKMKAKFTKKDGLFELVRRTPLYYIDQVFGNFNTKEIFASLFEATADAEAMYKKAVTELNNRLDRAQDAVAKSFKYDGNKTLMSKYKMMTYMIQLEAQSNPDSKQVNPAVEHLKKTIEHIENGKTSFSEKDAGMLQQILDEYGFVTGQDESGEDIIRIDTEKLYNSFNQAEREAIKTIQDINESLTDKAIYTASIIRGDKINALNNYVHLNVLHEHRPDEAVSGVAFTETYNDSLRPSTKAKSLIERTGKVSPLNFDVFASANRGAKFVLMDYYLTEPIRTARKTINETSKALREESKKPDFQGDAKQQRQILNAIDRAFEEAVENLLTTSFVSTSIAEDAVNYVAKQGYRAVLASLPRFVGELSSNIAFAMIAAPKDFKAGYQYRDVVLSADAANIMANTGSKQTNRLFPHDTLSGRMIDTSIMDNVVGIRGGRANSDIKNKALQIYNRSLKKYQNSVETIADALIATPDKMVMRPMWFGAFANEFERVSGAKVDFDKIAAGDEIYMADNKEAIDAARVVADDKTVLTGAADNAFMGILKGSPKPNQSGWIRGFNLFNNFMTRFLIYEYATARTGINAVMGNGTLSRRQGAALLGAVTTRMVMYGVVTSMLSSALVNLFVDDEDEEDEKSLLQKIGQGMASAFTSLVLGRDFGNATKSIINYGVERMNEEYLDFLRNGEYDMYKDAIQYTFIPDSKKGKGIDMQDLIMNLGGPFGPSMKTAELALKKATGPEKKEAAAIERSKKENSIRLPLEVFGNLGFVPLYKDVRKIVMAQIYKDLKKTKDNTNKGKGAMLNKEDMERYFPEMYKELYGEQYDYDKLIKEIEKEMKEMERAAKDEMYDYKPKPK